MTNPLELNFKPMSANQWLDWSRSYWRNATERKYVQWEPSYPSNSEWGRRLGLSRETIRLWGLRGVTGVRSSGWSVLFHELEGPHWRALNLAPMRREQLQLFIDMLGSRRAVSHALGLNEHVIGEWLMADAVTTSYGWSALLWWLFDDMGLGNSPPAVGVVNGFKTGPKVNAFIRSQAITNVPSRVIAQRTGCSHTTVNNVLRRGNDD